MPGINELAFASLFLLTALIILPVTIFLCVKMAVLGYYRAKESIKESSKRSNEEDSR